MIVELPLDYTVDGKRYRERKDHTVYLRDFVEFQVAEASEDDAPVGVEISDGTSSERLRHYGGAWWMPDRGTDPRAGELRTALLLASEDMTERLNGGSLFLAGITRYKSDYDTAVRRQAKPLEAEGFREVTRNRREDALRGLTAKVAEDLLAVSGVLHVRVPEPFMTLTFADDGIATARVSMGTPHHRKADNRTFVFGVDRGAEYEGAILDYGDATGKDVDRFNEAVYYGGPVSAVANEADDLFYAGQSLLSSTRFKMPEWPADDAMVWFGLRDALAEAAPPGAVKPLQERMDAVAERLAALSSRRQLPYFARAAAERWTYRQIDVEDGIAPSLA